MTLVLPIGVANTRFVFSCQGIVESMGFSIATVSTPEVPAAAIAFDLNEAWTTSVIGSASQWNDEFTYLGTQTTLMTSSGPIVAAESFLRPGTNAGDAPSVNCSILISKLTNLGGRANRGRFNIPSGKVEEASVSAAGFILPATVAALQNQSTEFYDAMVSREEQPVLLHSNGALAPTIVEGFLVSSQLATQRRRMR